MAFAYYGAKHGLSRKYQPPRYSTIIEPFAGAAGYSCRWATPTQHVILNDYDPVVVGLWRRLSTMSPSDLLAIEPVLGQRTTDLLVASCGGSSSWAGVAGLLMAGMGGGEQWKAVSKGGSRQITPRMVNDWPSVRRRIIATLPRLQSWEFTNGDYRDLPDIEATWFIDPPYQPLGTMAGKGYVHGAAGIDYAELAEWCQSRKGQVIVCEQAPADWLPFRPLATQQHAGGKTRGAIRTEVVWTSDAVTLDIAA